MEACISKRELEHERILVSMSANSTEATMSGIIYPKGKYGHKTLKRCGTSGFATVEGITKVLNGVQEFTPALVYTMTIGSHDTGQSPVDGTQTHFLFRMREHWEYQRRPLTRCFGGLIWGFQTGAGTLARGIVNTGIRMEYILFGDYYMSSVKAAYKLRKATKFLIASTSEVMACETLHTAVGGSLLGDPSYGSLYEGFHNFYPTYKMMSCGILAVVGYFELDNVAATMKGIDDKYVFGDSL